MTKKEVLQKIKSLGKISKEQRNEIVCSLIGHSKIITMCFGYVTCGRCDAQIGDTWGSMFDPSDYVIVGHNCKKCRKNYKACTWKDKLYALDPFVKASAEIASDG